MAKYSVVIGTTVSKHVYVEADSLVDAEDKALEEGGVELIYLDATFPDTTDWDVIDSWEENN